jgi:CRISPR-associated protein Cmr6
MLARRELLQALEYSSHAGLTLQKLLKAHDNKNESAHELLEAISKTTPSDEAYTAAFQRWQNNLPENTVRLDVTTKSALAIGLGNTSPLEIGLTIHHTYGTPYLPGSAIKGLLTRAADTHELTPEAKAILFGTTDAASHLIYWDAMLKPSSIKPFQQDVITVHHPNYYNSSGKDGFPTDFDDPNPVPFLSVKPGTTFVVAISSNSESADEWLHLAAALLKYALENLGLGGKTNAGYGYFEVKLPERKKTDAEKGTELLTKYRDTISSIKAAQDLSKADDLITKLELLSDAERRPTLEALREQMQRIKQWNPEKARCQKIQALLVES